MASDRILRIDLAAQTWQALSGMTASLPRRSRLPLRSCSQLLNRLYVFARISSSRGIGYE